MGKGTEMNPVQPHVTVRDNAFSAVLQATYIFVAVLVFACTAHADEGTWNTTDKALLAAVETSYYIDYRQTRQIALNPRRYYEHNQIMGEHPSVGRVNNYFLASAIGTYLLADILPDRYRRLFLAGALTVEVVTVVHNHKVGLRYSF